MRLNEDKGKNEIVGIYELDHFHSLSKSKTSD